MSDEDQELRDKADRELGIFKLRARESSTATARWLYNGLTNDGHFHGSRAKIDKAAKKVKAKARAAAKASRKRNRG